MKKRTLIICFFVSIVAVFIIWSITWRAYSPTNSVQNLALSPNSVEKITLKYGTGTLISIEIPEITVNHSMNETMLIVTANRTLIMGNPTILNVKNITYDVYNGSLTEEEFNELVARLNYIFLHAKPYFGSPGLSTGRWSLLIYLNNSEKITLAKNVELWINGKPYTCELPEEKNPVRYLTELGYKVIKEGQ